MHFELGDLVRVEPVAAGIENTTYFLWFQKSGGRTDEYVLTIGESIGAPDMSFVARLTTLLHEHGLPVPAPVVMAGQALLYFEHKPALLIPKMAGSPPLQPSARQCRAVGTALAKLHEVMLRQKPVITHESHRGLPWVAQTGRAMSPHLDTADRQLLESSLDGLEQFTNAHTSLPQAIIHGDLFRDNALFVDDELIAIIDFFSAGDGYLLFDLAVVANDWCTQNGQLDPKKVRALIAAYEEVRTLTSEERQCWAGMLAIAALRFWVSRLADQVLPRPDRARPPHKDPKPYRDLLIRHREFPMAIR
jgi:homoserine kinase type II